MGGFPVQVCIARPDDLDTLVEWLSLREIYEEAFWLAAPPEPAWVRRSMLLVENNLMTELQPVRFWSVLQNDQLIGMGVDFGWDTPEDTERELDFAIPRSPKKNPRLPGYVLAALSHRLFVDHGATKVWGRVRAGVSGRGFPRLFEYLGARAEDLVWDHQPTTGLTKPRVYYATTPETFYASILGKRLAALEAER